MGLEQGIALHLPAGKAARLARQIIQRAHQRVEPLADGGQVVVVRVLAPVVEPVMALLRSVWLAWRSELWQLGFTSPRIWST